MRRLCSLLTYSTAANRTLRVVTHQPTTLFKNWFPSSTFTYWGPIYIYSNAKQEKSNLDLNTSKKEGHDDKIQVYSLLRTSHGFVLKNTSVRASYINFFLAF